MLPRPAFTSRLRSERTAALLGLWLGIAFGTCLLTGLVSHAIQQPPDWFVWPSRPVNLYRVTQGLHVATGLACVPLLLAKLWAVYPHLFTWPPVRDAGHAVSRLAVVLLVASALFQVASGVLNVARWYGPLGFFFTTTHFWVAWVTVGAMLLHIGAQLPVIRRSVGRKRAEPAEPEPAAAEPAAAEPAEAEPAEAEPAEPTLTRRGLLTGVAAAAGVITVATVGQTVAPLSGVSVLAPRVPDVGPQGLPVNKSARSAGVRAGATDPAYRLVVQGAERLELGLDELFAAARHTVRLPITCVEGWSADGTWTGVRVRDLLTAVGADPDADVLVESLQRTGRYRTSVLAPPHARDPATLLAVRLNGAPLALDHGYPCRLIAPNRPGVLQTKWVARIGPDR